MIQMCAIFGIIMGLLSWLYSEDRSDFFYILIGAFTAMFYGEVAFFSLYGLYYIGYGLHAVLAMIY